MRVSISPSAFILTAMCMFSLAGEPPSIPWYTIDGGGAMRSTSANDRFELSGTIGQPDAGVMVGGDFKLTGGFWFETQLGDCNGNGIRDLGDHKKFVDCMGGPDPNEEALGACRCFDTSGDELVTLLDFAESQREFAAD